jgi:hypothetical protein
MGRNSKDPMSDCCLTATSRLNGGIFSESPAVGERVGELFGTQSNSILATLTVDYEAIRRVH